MTSFTFPELVALLEVIFLRGGTNERVAHILAMNCAMCERDGSKSHGLFRMKGYVDTLKSGWVDGKATPILEDVAPGFCRIDAANGFAQPALPSASDLAIQKAKANGAAVLSIRNSHHLSALWPNVEPFAEKGLLALSVVNSFACTVPFDGTRPLFGTNPIAFAAPRQGGAPIVFDMATSALANGDVQIAAREGKELPPDVGVNSLGEHTTDPDQVLEGGALLPFGGYKGSALSMMNELLAAALTGGYFSFEFDWSTHPGAQAPHTGQFLLLIDPEYAGGAAFGARSAQLVQLMQEAGVSRIPGDRRAQHRLRSESEGIPVSQAELAALEAIQIA